MPPFGSSGGKKPAPVLPPALPPDENEKVRNHRVARFEEMGLPYPLALELAMVGADWHRVGRAVDAGASHELIIRIFV